MVGICGGSGSGKTTLLHRIEQSLGKRSVCTLSLDNYYLPKEQQSVDNQGETNFDLPTALDRKRLFEDVQQLLLGHSITFEEYDFNVSKEKKTVELQPGEVLILEGLFVFHYEEIQRLLNFGIFIDVHDDIQLERRLRRDIKERGYKEEAIRYQWDNHVRPCFNKYLAPYRENADFRFNNDLNFDHEFARLRPKLEEALMAHEQQKDL